MKTALKYPGAKWRIANWIIERMPDHHSYLEPFFGSGAVFFNKTRSNIETVNDLDSRIVTMFRVIRDRPGELADACLLTPYSREEYGMSFTPHDGDNEIEQTRKFIVQLSQSFGARTSVAMCGWKNDVQGRERAYAATQWGRLPTWVMDAADRLRGVQIEHLPAVDVIRRFQSKKVLVYCDPPYVLSSRTGKQYKHEMTDSDHVDLLNALIEHPGPVILSGYHSTLYDEMLVGWHRDEFQTYSPAGTPKTEVLWMNYQSNRQISM